MSEIAVLGVGGAGCDYAFRTRALTGQRIVAVNTDRAALKKSLVHEQLLIGVVTCKGEAACTPDWGRRAAQESQHDLEKVLAGMRSLVLLGGLGGGTGTGALPVIASIAKARGLQVHAAVSLPFAFEASRRRIAMEGLHRLNAIVASVFVYDHAVEETNVATTNSGLIEVLERATTAIAGHAAALVSDLLREQ